MSKKSKKALSPKPDKLENVQVATKNDSTPLHWWLLLGILALTFIVFIPSLQNGFTNWDDPYYVVENTLIKKLNLEHLKGIFTTSERSLYHPFTMLSFALNYQISELSPFAYHFTNLLFHLFNTFLVFYFIFLLSNRRIEVALIVALFFGIHPVHVESVAWISERKDVLYTFFFLGALITYLKYIKSGKIAWYVWTLVLGLASAFSKATAVMLPLILWTIDYFKDRKDLQKIVLEKIPFLIVSIIFGLLTIKYQSTGAIGAFEEFSIPQRILFACYGFVLYIFKLFVPLSLSAFYPYPNVAEGLSLIYYAAPILFLLIIGGAIYSLKYTKVIAFGLLFYFWMICLNLKWVSVGGAIMADRYTYTPYIGLLFILAYGFSELWRGKDNKEQQKNIGYGVLGLLIITSITFAYLTFERCKVWKNSNTLWTDVIEKCGQVPFAHYNRAIEYHYKDQNHTAALGDYTKAIQAKANYKDAYYNRGVLYHYELNDLEKALADYNKTVTIAKEYAPAYYTRGILYYNNLEDYDKAIADFDKAISLKKDMDEAYNNRGMLYFNKKQNYEAALKDFNEAIKLNDENGQYFLNRAFAYYKMGNKTKALENAKQAQQLGQQVDSNFLNALNNRHLE